MYTGYVESKNENKNSTCWQDIYTLYYLLMSVFLSCTKVLLDLIPN